MRGVAMHPKQRFSNEFLRELRARILVAVGRRGITVKAAAKEVGVCERVMTRVTNEESLSQESAEKILLWLLEQESVAA